MRVCFLLQSDNANDVLILGPDFQVSHFLFEFNENFRTGKAAKSTGTLKRFGFQTTQHDSYTSIIYRYEIWNALEPYLLSRLQRLESDKKLNSAKKSEFMPLNPLLG